MGNHWKSFVWLVFVCSACLLTAGCGEGKEEKAVRECMAKVDAAGNANDPADLAANLSAASFQYWDRLIPIARSGNRTQIMSLPPSERNEIVMMRHRCTADELKKLSGAFWLKTAMERGGYFGEGDTELGKIRVRGDFAEAQLLWDRSPAEDLDGNRITTLFVKEQTGWKFDLPHNDKFLNWLIEFAASMERRNVDDFLLDLEEESTGKRPRGDIYDRPN